MSLLLPASQTAAAAGGFSPDLADRLAAGVRSGLLRHLHSVLVVRKGQTALETYFSGDDQAWDEELGTVDFDAATLHDVRSITKSVVSLLYGIALERGLVPGLDEPLVRQFPQYPDLAGDPLRDRIKIVHALTMTLGTSWDETRPYSDPANSERLMEASTDRDRFILERPIITTPGSKWTYSGGAVALLGTLIARGTGQALIDFARDALFAPLGIDRIEWATGEDGVVSAASGLRLVPRDLARIGEMLLAHGVWNGRQIVPRSWIEESFTPAVTTHDGLNYGRLWFIGEAPCPALSGPQRWMGAFGNGGQRLWLMPSADLVVTILSGNYDAPDAWITPVRVWREIILANLVNG